jgi:uncharacterized protein with von Willebrand factor type A (vWA) domain
VRVRYGRWSGSQDPFPHDVTAEVVLDELSEDLLDGLDPANALRRLLQRGMRGRIGGLDELRRRVEEARRRELGRLGLDGPLERLAGRVEEIVDKERTAASFDATGRGEARQAELDALPDDVAGRLAALEGSDWIDPQARADFDALLDELRRDLAQATFGQLAGAMGAMGPADVARLRDLLAELGDLIDADARGEDVTEAFEEF